MTAARITITKMVYTMPMALTPRRLRRTLSGEDLRAADEREELRRRVPVADRDARVDRRGHDRVQPALRRLLLEAREVEDADAGVRGVDGRIRSDGGERLRRRKRAPSGRSRRSGTSPAASRSPSARSGRSRGAAARSG